MPVPLVPVLSLCDVSMSVHGRGVPCLWHVRPSVVVAWSWSVRLSLWSVVSRAVRLSWVVCDTPMDTSVSNGLYGVLCISICYPIG